MRKTRLPLLVCLLLAACAPQAGPAGLPQETAPPAATATASFSFDELLLLGQDAANRADWAAALAYLDAAVAADAASARALLLRAGAHQALGDSPRALEDYTRAIEIDPVSAAAYQGRGLAYAQLGDTQAALADLSRAVQVSPTFAQAYRNRADLRISLGDFTAAAFDLHMYLDLLPAAPDAAALNEQIAALQEQAAAQAGAGGLLFSDDFANSESGWYVNGGEPSTGAYAEGGYLLTENRANNAAWALPGRLARDVRVQASATRLGGDDNNFFGLMCRVQGAGQSGNYYAFIISSDGFFGITKKSGDTLSLVGQEAMLRHPAINLGAGPNIITAVCAGNRLALYVNGQFVVETTDDEYSSGQVGFIVGAFDVPGASILFGDFSVYAEQP